MTTHSENRRDHHVSQDRLAAVAALGTASLTASTPAAAKGFHGGGFHGGHFHGGGFRIYSGVGLYDDCIQTVRILKRNGDVVLRTYNACL